MDSSFSFLAKPLFTIFFIFSATFSPCLCSSEEEEVVYFTVCSDRYDCGSLENIPYPFWGTNFRPQSCGRQGFKIDCQNNKSLVIQMNDQEFDVLEINKTGNTMRIARSDLSGKLCMIQNDVVPITLNYSLFDYAPYVQNLTLIYGCQQPPSKELLPSQTNFACTLSNGTNQTVYYDTQGQFPSRHQNKAALGSCKPVQVPVSRSFLDQKTEGFGEDQVEEAVKQGFDVDYSHQTILLCKECEKSGGRCGSNVTNDAFLCYCRDKHYDVMCPPGPESSSTWRNKVIIGTIAAASALLLACVIICVIRSKKSSTKFFSTTTKSDKDIEGFIGSYGCLHVKRYRFSDIKQMTISFKEKLGRGGYGEVYKGKLFDGRLVAVKVLNAMKGNGEEFVNEVASISRTSHKNVVTLLGFCLESSKRALVYEFMSNGSLEKFIYNENPLETTPQLEWEKLLQIAKGIAQGLQYLHCGCNTRILHFDIKPHNILLDGNFCPKVADFGLAKLCERKESIISMADARGTIGYIAPEIFNRNFGRVSHKSDVYSYGMMILEMVGGRKNIKVGVSNTSEIYFPHWIYKNLKLGSDLRLHGVVTAEEHEIARKMVLVGLWCIQTNPSDRPSMRKVIEMLEGGLEAMQIPPKPFFSSPQSQEESSSTT